MSPDLLPLLIFLAFFSYFFFPIPPHLTFLFIRRCVYTQKKRLATITATALKPMCYIFIFYFLSWFIGPIFIVFSVRFFLSTLLKKSAFRLKKIPFKFSFFFQKEWIFHLGMPTTGRARTPFRHYHEGLFLQLFLILLGKRQYFIAKDGSGVIIK